MRHTAYPILSDVTRECEVCKRKTKQRQTVYPDETSWFCPLCETRESVPYAEGLAGKTQLVIKDRTPKQKQMGRPKKPKQGV